MPAHERLLRPPALQGLRWATLANGYLARSGVAHLNEANVFTWPEPDLRFVPGKRPPNPAYGFLPPKLFRVVRDRFIERARRRQAGLVRRSEA